MKVWKKCKCGNEVKVDVPVKCSECGEMIRRGKKKTGKKK